MSAIIILLCLVNFAGSLQITTKSPVEVNKGQSGQLKWIFSTVVGETFVQGDITVQKQGQSTRKTVAYINRDFNLKVLSFYSSRSWSVAHVRNTKEIILNVQNVQTSDDGTYYMKLHFSRGNVDVEEEKGVKLDVLVKPFYPLGSHSVGPITVDERKQVTIKCEPEGSPKPINIIWDKNGVEYKRTDTDNPNLVFNNVSRHDSGVFLCKAKNKAGFATTEPSIQLIVKYKPVNTKFNSTAVLVVGGDAVLKCSAQADPLPQFKIHGGGLREETSSTGRKNFKVKLGDDGKTVSCTPYNRLGDGPTVHLKLDVKVPAKVLGNFGGTMKAIEGRNYSVPCSASGDPAPTIIWLKNGAPLRNQPQTYVVNADRPDKTYEVKSTLTLSPARREDNGKYGCEAKNRHGSEIKSVILNLMYRPIVQNTNEFGEREVRVGDFVSLDCRAVGNPSTTHYVWRWQNGTLIQNRTTGRLVFDGIHPYEGGRLSCAGGSSIGEGQKQFINLLVRVPPRIIVAPPLKISLNESTRLQLFCNASGVPKPTIFWYREGEKLRKTGDHFSISHVTHEHKGKYTCTADNGIMPNASASSDVTIYYRPVIKTTSAANTIVGAGSGEKVTLVCTAHALPLAKFKWLSYPSMHELNTSVPGILDIQLQRYDTYQMEVIARFGAKYLCFAYNNRGNDTQVYEIRPKGPPEAPVLNMVYTYIKNEENKLSTVHAHIKWTPGYNGGQRVWYKVYYGPRADRLQIIPEIDDQCNCVTINDLKANTDYVFYVQALNNDGPSNGSNIIRSKTKAFYGSASVERLDEGKIVKVSFWIYAKENLTKEVRFREKIVDSIWDIRTTDSREKPLVIEGLDPEKHYEFQVLWRVKGEVQITDAGEVSPWFPRDNGKRPSSGLTKEEIIAVIAGVGGFLLIVILVLFLCLIRRRQKPKRDENVIVMRRKPENVDVVTRRSLIGSVEDDPFESAHYGTLEKKKKARDSYYLPDSEDMNTFAPDNSEKRVNPAESSQAYQPYKFNQKKSKYSDEDASSSDDDSYQYKTVGQKQRPSDDEISSEPGYARVDDVNGKIPRDHTDGLRDQPRPNPNDVYAKINKGNNNNRPTSNGRGAPPPYRPRSTADTPLPPYPSDQLDLDDPSAVPFDDPLPPPMPVLPTSHSNIPDGIWDDRYSNDPRDSVDTTLERQKSPSRTSLGGKPYINAQGKLVRPGSSSRYSSSENFDDSEQRSPEPEAPTGRSRHLGLDNDNSNLVSYLV